MVILFRQLYIYIAENNFSHKNKKYKRNYFYDTTFVSWALDIQRDNSVFPSSLSLHPRTVFKKKIIPA